MNTKRVRTPAGEGEIVGRVVRDGKVESLIVMMWRCRPTDAATVINGLGMREARLFRLDEYFEVSDGSCKILRRIG